MWVLLPLLHLSPFTLTHTQTHSLFSILRRLIFPHYPLSLCVSHILICCVLHPRPLLELLFPQNISHVHTKCLHSIFSLDDATVWSIGLLLLLCMLSWLLSAVIVSECSRRKPILGWLLSNESPIPNYKSNTFCQPRKNNWPEFQQWVCIYSKYAISGARSIEYRKVWKNVL